MRCGTWIRLDGFEPIHDGLNLLCEVFVCTDISQIYFPYPSFVSNVRFRVRKVRTVLNVKTAFQFIVPEVPAQL